MTRSEAKGAVTREDILERGGGSGVKSVDSLNAFVEGLELIALKFEITAKTVKTGKVETVETNVQKVPLYSSREWHDFIISQLRPDEMTSDGLPLVHGLRRVAEEFLGEIIANHPVRTYQGVDGYACEWELIIVWKLNLPEYIDITRYLPTRKFGAAVDANLDATPDPYRQHLLATADTKAEAKALRRALNLRCYAAEEIDRTEEIDKINLEEQARPEQINLIRVICKRVGIDIQKLLLNNNLNKDLNDLTRGEAANLNQILHSYTSNLSGEKKEVPKEILI